MELGLLEQLVELLETIAPEVWEAAMRQVGVDTVTNAGIATLLVFAIILAVVGIRWTLRVAEKDDDAYIGTILFSVISIALLILLVFIATGVIGRFINPEFYAIEKLLGLVSGG